MADSIATRVTRIVSGSIHALLEAVETAAPEITLAQAIREVEEVIDDVRAEMGRVLADKHVASANLTKLNQRHEELCSQIELAVGKKEEDLARAGIAKQLDIEAQAPVLEKAIAEAADKERELEGYLFALQAKKRDMEDGLNEFIRSRAVTSTTAVSDAPGSAGQQRLDRAESAFDRVLARHAPGMRVGPTEAAANATKLKELNELARNHRIDERLAAFRAKAGK